MIDFDGISAAALSILPELLSDWFPAGKRHGNEWVLGDFSGAPGRSLSINLRTAKFCDFASGTKGGDAIAICAHAFHGGDRVAAARDLGKRLGFDVNGQAPERVAAAAHVSATAPAACEWEPMDPAGVAEPVDVLAKWDIVHRYQAADGALIGYVVRRGNPKKIVPLNYGRLSGVVGWHFKHLRSPRPLYGLDRLAARPDAPVLLVEGEKAAEAAIDLFPDYVPVTWQAGAQNISNTDWAPLAGREVVLWPDADVPGYFAAAEILRAIPSAHVLDVIGEEQGFDAADLAVGDPADWLSSHIAPASHVLDVVAAMVASGMKKEGPLPAREWFAAPAAAAVDDMPEYPDYMDYDGPEREHEPVAEPEPAPVVPVSRERGESIVPLGHDRGTYYYFSGSTGQVEAVQASQHSRSMLTHLASEAYYWQRTRFVGKNGVDWHAAADDLMVQCKQQGIFDANRLRGRGAWLDGGRSVLHMGDELILDGQRSGLQIADTNYVYEQMARLDMDLGEPLSDVEADQLRKLCTAAPWEAPEHMGQLLAGWCVIAPVCGAMPWRPHMWITSEAGGGKSWVLDNIIKPIVGPIALEVQSKTTEAGIRQTLGCDARPVIFDEAETQNERDRDRVQLVLDLARQASNEEGAAIIKGSSSGKAMQYHIRSCFVFSSINVGMSQSADESRTVVLTLAVEQDKKKRLEAFEKLKAQHALTMIPGFSGRLLARTLALLPVIRTNALVFAEAIARAGNSRRTGDTYGVLLAGAWSLRSSRVITAAEADQQVANKEWIKQAVVKAVVEEEWKRAINTLLQYRTRVRSEDIPVSELIEWSRSADDGHDSMPFLARRELDRIGMRVASVGGHHVLQIATNSTTCAEIFARTPWASSWSSTLTRMPHAKRNATSVWMAGKTTKVFHLPLDIVLG